MNVILPTRTMLASAAAVAMAATLGAGTVQAEVKAHVVDSSNQVWMNNYGECWRASYATDEPRVECGDIGDADGDGVLDDKDECPNTPMGAKVDERGCELDSDGDGVVDSKDKCPGTPRGAKVDADGCEIVVKQAPPPLVLEGVNFKHDSAQLTDQAKSILNGVAESLKARPDQHVTVVGHTDSDGSDAYNMGLSQRRAESVRSYLVSKGVSASNLSARGEGESKPIADNKTKEGRAKNRRVELHTMMH